MRIGIDARFYGPVGKGLGRYTQEVVDNLIKIDRKNEYVIFLCRENFDLFNLDEEYSNVKKVLINVRWYTVAEQFLMPFYIWRERVDLMHYHHFNVPVFAFKKFVVTIHDLILIKFPTARATSLGPLFYKLKNLAYRMVISHAVKNSKKIFAVSQFTKDDIVEHFKVDENKIKVTYEGVADQFKGRESETAFHADFSDENQNKNNYAKDTLAKYDISGDYLLYVGNAYPHKNLEALLQVFVRVYKDNPNLKLVLVGKSDYFFERTKEYAKKLRLWSEQGAWAVVFPGYVPDNDLDFLYENALAYVFPSKFEGFGLPPLEAMAKGCSVISSNSTSMPEILGDAALYFDPMVEDDMYNKITKIIIDRDLREALQAKGFEQIKKFSWRKCAEITLRVFQSV